MRYLTPGFRKEVTLDFTVFQATLGSVGLGRGMYIGWGRESSTEDRGQVCGLFCSWDWDFWDSKYWSKGSMLLVVNSFRLCRPKIMSKSERLL